MIEYFQGTALPAGRRRAVRHRAAPRPGHLRPRSRASRPARAGPGSAGCWSQTGSAGPARWSTGGAAPIVALSFLTVGFQTVANVAAGVARMPLRRYLPALAIGGLAWALLYATLGVIGFAGFARLYAVSPVAAIVVGVGIAAAVTALRGDPARQAEGPDPPGPAGRDIR